MPIGIAGVALPKSVLRLRFTLESTNCRRRKVASNHERATPMIDNPVQFFTTGLADWRRVLPAGAVRDFYGHIYPTGIPWQSLPTSMLEACRAWVECDFARADGDRLMPMIPILTQPDRDLLHPWVASLAAHMATVVGDELAAFRRLAAQFSNRWSTAEHILTILMLW